MGIAGPSQSFISLRSVGWNFNEVAQLGCYDVFMKLVVHRVGAYKGAGIVFDGTQYNPGNGFGATTILLADWDLLLPSRCNSQLNRGF